MNGDNSFRARLSSREHPAGIAAQVRVAVTGLSVTSAGDEEHWPWRELRHRAGAFGGGAQLEHAAHGSLLVFEDDAILAAMLVHAPSALPGAVSTTVSRRVNPLLVIGLVAAAIGVGAWLAIPLMAAAIARGVPLDWEEQFGDAALQAMVPEARRVVDARITQPVEAIVARLAAAQDSPYRFRVIVAADSQVNAFAAPGGRMVVHTGLIRFAGSADELAGVIAHEMEHVRKRHVTVSLFQKLSLQVLLGILFGDAGGALGGGAEVASRLTALSFSREAEREADAGGAALMHAAGVDARAMLRMLERMRALERAALPELLSTHPAPESRVADLRRQLEASASRTHREPRTPVLAPESWQALRAATAATD